jgi:hypothetical protein
MPWADVPRFSINWLYRVESNLGNATHAINGLCSYAWRLALYFKPLSSHYSMTDDSPFNGWAVFLAGILVLVTLLIGWYRKRDPLVNSIILNLLLVD